MHHPTLIRRVAATAAITLLTLLSSASVFAQRGTAPMRIGIVDSRRLLQDMPGRSQAESQFALEMATARSLVHTATDSMKSAVEELGRTEGDLRPQQREAAMLIMRSRELTLEDMVTQLNLLADKRLDELQAPLIEKMRDAIKTVRTRERLALVIDLASANGVVDFAEELDVTALVLVELRRPNAEAAGKRP